MGLCRLCVDICTYYMFVELRTSIENMDLNTRTYIICQAAPWLNLRKLFGKLWKGRQPYEKLQVLLLKAGVQVWHGSWTWV